jgi:hypothetical protein
VNEFLDFSIYMLNALNYFDLGEKIGGERVQPPERRRRPSGLHIITQDNVN